MRIVTADVRGGHPRYGWLAERLKTDWSALDLAVVRRRLLACALRELWHLPPKMRTRAALRDATRDIALRHGAPDHYAGVCTKWMQRHCQRVTDVARRWRPRRLVGRAMPVTAGRGLTHAEADALRRRLRDVEAELRAAREDRGVRAMTDFRTAMGLD